MHSYHKEKDGTYAVGQWVSMAIEYRFIPIFYCVDRAHAIAAVVTLNGGERIPFETLYEEKPRDPARRRRTLLIWFAVGAAIAFAVTMCVRAGAAHACQTPECARQIWGTHAQGRTYYDHTGKAITRSTTDSQGTTTYYGADGRVQSKSSPDGTLYGKDGRVIIRPDTTTTKDKR